MGLSEGLQRGQSVSAHYHPRSHLGAVLCVFFFITIVLPNDNLYQICNGETRGSKNVQNIFLSFLASYK